MHPDQDTIVQHSPHAVLSHWVFDGRRWHSNVAVLIEDGRIRGLAPWSEVPEHWPQQRLPDGALLAPGFIDLQVNGGGGILLNDDPTAESMRAIARAHRRYGTTACLPTLISDSRQRTQAAIAAARSAAGSDGVLGLHLEGPFISPARPGIHRLDHIVTPSLGDLDWLADLAGAGRSLITLAPERLPDGFLRRLAGAGIRVSVGHSEATAEIVMKAVADGLSGVTHLFNAMPPFAGRQPGIVGAAFAEQHLTAGIIVDGVHVDPIAIRAAFAAKGADGMTLVTDAMPSVGAGLDQFQLMGRTISLHEGRLTAPDGTLAGAHLDMASAVRNAVRLVKLPLDDALRAASLTPARFLGVEGERGALTHGARADMVALTPDLEVVGVWVDGAEQSWA
ncbi:MAG TPA: N-acetylglucosamine-6-phosphate deacetylase [Xanthobacteraceae bacterium]|nr:N-acetylglucosamine-6-phosphate deacetylase [Xanthobacteraceae bacterium]